MKEVVAKRDKSFFLLITAVGLFTVICCVMGVMFFSRFMWFYIIGLVVMGAVSLLGSIGLCLPQWVIIKDADNLIIHNGFRGFKKKTIKITDIVGAKAAEQTQQTTVKRNGNIILTVKEENSATTDIVVVGVKNVSEVVKKLNALIRK